MWHEARKQEKKIRGMMVDYKRRAERRREYYEKIKQDPAQFLQVHGRPAKIHLDPAVAIAADSPATMMPWQGHNDNLIDRFDVRAHLDIIPEYKPPVEIPKVSYDEEDRKTCYEQYRTLVQNDFLLVNEDKFLHQIFMEERFGIFKPGCEEEKKKLVDKKAAIGYVYEDSTESPPRSSNKISEVEEDEENEEDKEDDLSDLDLGKYNERSLVRQEYLTYFMSGMIATESYYLYQDVLLYREANYEAFANSSINPTKNTVNYFYKCWKDDNKGPKADPFERLKEKSKLYEKNGTSVITSVEYPWTVLIVTPLMKRAQNLPSAKEIIFVDSTFSHDNSGATVTAMLTTTKVGAVPIAVFIQENQTKESYMKAFKLLRNNFPFSFGNEQAPLIFMSDDSEARKSAYTEIWPTAQQLLCRFHVLQALWRFLWSTRTPKESIPSLIRLFHNVMYSNTEESLAKSVQDVLDLENSFPEFVKHFKVFYRRKEEWVSYYCMETLANNNDTINYSEASIRVLKDIFLTRSKVLNILTLTEFCISVLDANLIRELLNHIYNRPRKAALLYTSLSKKVTKNLEIKAYSDKEVLLVQSENLPSYFYTVNVDVGICSCANGKTGAFCRHQVVLHLKKKINLPNLPTASLIDQYTLAFLALDSKCPPLSVFQFVQSALVESMNNIAKVQSLNADCDQQPSPPVDDSCSNNMELATDNENNEYDPLSFSQSVPNANVENISYDAEMQTLNADYDLQHLQPLGNNCSNVVELATNSVPLSFLQSMKYTTVENTYNEDVMQSLNAEYYEQHPEIIEDSCNNNIELATDSDKDDCINEILRVIKSRRVSRSTIKSLTQILRKI